MTTTTATNPCPNAANAPWVARNAAIPLTTRAAPITTRPMAGRVTLHSITRGGWPLPADELADQLVDGAAAAPDDQRGAHRREHERPDDRVGNPKPDRLRQQQHAEHHGTERGNLHPVGAAPTSGARDRRGGAVVFGEPQPACEVQDDAGAAREREHDEREAHQVRFDLESVADPAGDTGDELVVRPTRQARVRRGGRAGEPFHVRFLESSARVSCR